MAKKAARNGERQSLCVVGKVCGVTMLTAPVSGRAAVAWQVEIGYSSLRDEYYVQADEVRREWTFRGVTSAARAAPFEIKTPRGTVRILDTAKLDLSFPQMSDDAAVLLDEVPPELAEANARLDPADGPPTFREAVLLVGTRVQFRGEVAGGEGEFPVYHPVGPCQVRDLSNGGESDADARKYAVLGTLLFLAALAAGLFAVMCS